MVSEPPTADLTGLFSVTAPGMALNQDWLEAMAGIRMPLSEATTAFTTSVTTQVFSDHAPLVHGRLGLSYRF